MNHTDTINEICNMVRSNPDFDWSTMGRVTVKRKGDLLLFNYKPECQYADDWNRLELVSRGLIIHKDGYVVARPYPKFFNWMQGGRYTNAPIAEVREKVDGSLGIIYWHDGEWNVATRGSFDSEQAQWAKQYLENNIDTSGLNTMGSITLLAEIIYPGNRIVLDYEGRESLVLLDVVINDSGKTVYPGVLDTLTRYGWERPKRYDYIDTDALMDARQSIEHEGFVVKFEDGEIYKFKGEHYLHLHKLIHEISWKRAVKCYMNGTWNLVRDDLPDEFANEWMDMINTIDVLHDSKTWAINCAMLMAPSTKDRKVFAQYAMSEHPDLKSFMFAQLDGKPTTKIMEKYLMEAEPNE